MFARRLFTVSLSKSKFSPEIKIHASTASIPFVCGQKIPDISVLDSVPAHVDLVHRDDVFRIIVPYVVVNAKHRLANAVVGNVVFFV